MEPFLRRQALVYIRKERSRTLFQVHFELVANNGFALFLEHCQPVRSRAVLGQGFKWLPKFNARTTHACPRYVHVTKELFGLQKPPRILCSKNSTCSRVSSTKEMRWHLSLSKAPTSFFRTFWWTLSDNPTKFWENLYLCCTSISFTCMRNVQNVLISLRQQLQLLFDCQPR